MGLLSMFSRSKPAAPSVVRSRADEAFEGARAAEQTAEEFWRGSEGWLTCYGVQKTYKKRMVVKGVSIAVQRGEAVGLLGPNGAGKTTTFYMITGLVPADAGRITIDGRDVTRLPMYRRARLGIGYLPQEASIFRGLTVEQNIMAILELVEPNRRKRREQLDSLLDEFNISRLRKSPSLALSGGGAAAVRNRPGAGFTAVLYAARRAVRRHRSDCSRRYSTTGTASHAARNRSADHRSQCT